jgi:hypothetical protein
MLGWVDGVLLEGMDGIDVLIWLRVLVISIHERSYIYVSYRTAQLLIQLGRGCIVV